MTFTIQKKIIYKTKNIIYKRKFKSLTQKKIKTKVNSLLNIFINNIGFINRFINKLFLKGQNINNNNI